MEDTPFKCTFSHVKEIFTYIWKSSVRGKKLENGKANGAEPASPLVLPTDVIIEILCWLPLKTLAQFQLVCKQWKALTTDHYFIEKHMDHMPVMDHLFNVHTAVRRPDSYGYIDGCDGLVLLKMHTLKKYCLWNPVVHRILPLPDPHEQYYGLALLYVPGTINYRIVSIYNDKEPARIGCEVFTPGQSTAWQSLNFPDIDFKGLKKDEVNVSIVQAGGSVHCILEVKVDGETVKQVVSLDVGTECFSISQFLKGILDTWNLNWEGKLAFVKIVKNCLVVQELEDKCKKPRLSAKEKVMPLPFLKDISDDKTLFPLFAKESKIWFWLEDDKLFTYNIKTEILTDVRKQSMFSYSSNLYPYKPSLVTFPGMVQDDDLRHLRYRIKFP